MYFCTVKALFEKSKTEKSDEICKLANRNPTERNINVNYSTSAHNLVSSSFEVEKAIKSVLQGKAYTCPRFESIRQKLNHASCDIHPKDVPTRRELEVLQAVSEGLSTAEIGLRLDITENTVETFRRRLIQKFDAKNAIDLVVKAMAQGWIKVG